MDLQRLMFWLVSFGGDIIAVDLYCYEPVLWLL